MTQSLFVYGTLAPGQPNDYVLAFLGGSWQPATVRGHLEEHGWGARLGSPGLVLDESGTEITGLLFTSERLADHWAELDRFEGREYTRVLTQTCLDDGRSVEAHVYVLAPS